MGRANNALTTVAYVQEVVPGTTPDAPAFTLFRATGETLSVDVAYAESRELNGRRGVATRVPVSRSGSGGLDAELTALTLEAFIASALRGAWAANAVTSGDVDTSYTFEVSYETGATQTYKRLTGARIDSLTLKMSAAAKLSCSIGIVAADGDYSTVAIAGATYAAINSEPVQVGSHVGAITLSGLTVGVVTGVDLTIKNGAKPLHTLDGKLSATDVTVGGLDVTVSLTLILSSGELALLDAATGGTETGITLTVGATAGKKLTIAVPRLSVSAPKLQSSSPEGDTIVTVECVGLQSSALGGEVIRVTRAV